MLRLGLAVLVPLALALLLVLTETQDVVVYQQSLLTFQTFGFLRGGTFNVTLTPVDLDFNITVAACTADERLGIFRDFHTVQELCALNTTFPCHHSYTWAPPSVFRMDGVATYR